MKFPIDDKLSPCDSTVSEFRALTAGYYMIRSEEIYYKPTGRFKDVPNFGRYWFQFWKPKMVSKEIFEQSKRMGGQTLVRLEQGEVCPFPIMFKL